MGTGTSTGDESATITLLWRHYSPPTSRRGPRRKLDVDAVVSAATELADSEGLTALSLRRLADRLGIRPMSIYTYVPSRAVLLALMLDGAYAASPRPPHPDVPWQVRVRAVADLNLDLHQRHPWTAQLWTATSPLGPGRLRKYTYELAAFDGSGLEVKTVNDALTYLLAFVRSSALDMRDTRRTMTGRQHDRAGCLLPDLLKVGDRPLAARIKASAGAAARASTHDPFHAYEFGLERTMCAIDALTTRR